MNLSKRSACWLARIGFSAGRLGSKFIECSSHVDPGSSERKLHLLDGIWELEAKSFLSLEFPEETRMCSSQATNYGTGELEDCVSDILD